MSRQARPAHTWQPGSVGLLPSSGRTAGAPGVASWGFTALPLPTLAPWAGSCPIQSHSTVAFNAPTVGCHHGPSAGRDTASFFA